MWKPSNPPESRDQGFVLVLVLFMIMILTVLITRFTLRSRAILRQTEIYSHSVSALYIARAAVAIAKVAVVESSQIASRSGLNAITLNQPWATPIINYPVDNAGFVSGLIEDESSKFNINMLVGTPGGNIDPHKLLQFTRLFTLVGANPSLLPLISQWVTPAPNMTGPPGPYGGYTPSYRNRGDPWMSSPRCTRSPE